MKTIFEKNDFLKQVIFSDPELEDIILELLEEAFNAGSQMQEFDDFLNLYENGNK